MIGRLNHIAIAVPEPGAASAKYRDLLGAQVELLEPLGEDSPIAAFLAKSPSGGMRDCESPRIDLPAYYNFSGLAPIGVETPSRCTPGR
jgi:catechol 2,3-dioxygenase-like lactoylglutathione lyase family enzyme